MTQFPIDTIRQDFPALQQEINGAPLVYLDNGASTQKPQQVIDALTQFYTTDYANVHRGIHTLSQRATDQFEAARETVRDFINAKAIEEIIFTSGTTDSINLVADSFGNSQINAGDHILVSEMEHHSNIVPWQILAERKQATIDVIPVLENGELDIDAYKSALSEKTKIVALTQVSNALGTINPVKDMIAAAHKVGAKVVLDGAQSIAHMATDVQALDCDFFVLSGHKAFGPTGIGVLYGKQDLLEAMPPYRSGGDMIKTVSFSGTEYNVLPYKFEAGTPHIAGAIGLAAALTYLSDIGMDKIAAYETELLEYGTEVLAKIDGLRLIGTADNKAGILSFVIEGVHASDLGTLLDHQGVAIRVGHHCAMPVMEKFGLNATSRASLALYNNTDDLDRLGKALERACTMLA
jgi:cysteine desulfurase/selenocysteine lyase